MPERPPPQQGEVWLIALDATFDGRKWKAMADQIAAARTQRLRRRMGRLTHDDVGAVARAVRVQLDL